MKTIFIATDFSPAAHNATLYGIALAMEFDSEVILFNAFQVPMMPPAAIDIVSASEMIEKVNTLFDDELRSINSLDPSSIKIICEESLPASGILEKAADLNADLIIIGMKARGNGLRHFIDGTATILARRTNIPLLIIPETIKFSVPKIITLASDIIEETRANIHLLYFLRQIAEKFESRIHVLRVGKGKFRELHELVKPGPNLNSLLAKLDVTYKNTDDNNVTHGLMEFIKEQKADLLVMIPHKHDFLERVFIKSETKEMLFHTSIPMLVLPENPKMTPNHRAILSDRERLL
jgi:nucleotide-binding universal stress UspA family protein